MSSSIGTVYIAHGFEGYPEKNWFPWLKSRLKGDGFTVHAPQAPDAQWPNLPAWEDTMERFVPNPDGKTFFAAHSLGCITTLKYLTERHPGAPVAGGVLVSGFLSMPGLPLPASFFENPLNPALLQGNWTVISAEDDPLVPHEMSRTLAQTIGARFISYPRGGHFMDSEGCYELPAVAEIIESLAGLR